MNETSIGTMRKQYTEGGMVTIKDFVRKGGIGDWKNLFNDQQSKIIDAMLKVYFNGTEFKYYKDLMGKKEYLIRSKL